MLTSISVKCALCVLVFQIKGLIGGFLGLQNTEQKALRFPMRPLSEHPSCWAHTGHIPSPGIVFFLFFGFFLAMYLMRFDKCVLKCFCPRIVKQKGFVALEILVLHLFLPPPWLICTSLLHSLWSHLSPSCLLWLHPSLSVITEKKIFYFTAILKSVHLVSWEENHILNMRNRISQSQLSGGWGRSMLWTQRFKAAILSSMTRPYLTKMIKKKCIFLFPLFYCNELLDKR